MCAAYIVVGVELVDEALPHLGRIVDAVEARLTPVELDPLVGGSWVGERH